MVKNRPRITVAIPTHDMIDKEYFLRRALDSLWNQTFQDFDIVVSDNSEDTILQDVCDYYKTGITYFYNPRKGMAQNTNEAIKASKGELIKILYMDDFLAHNQALEEIDKQFEGKWMITGCEHSPDGIVRLNKHYPHYNGESLVKGINTIGSPSVLTIKNSNPLMFDEEMTWLLDCDYYIRLYHSYGSPFVSEDINVVIGLGEHQATSHLSDDRKKLEQEYLNKKYE